MPEQTNHFIQFTLETEPHSVRTKYTEEGTTLKDAAAALGYRLRTSCGGAGTCKKCKVIADGQEVLACQAKAENYRNIVIPVASLKPDEDKAVIQTKSATKTTEKISKPKRTGERYGIAVDIGTTTLAAEFYSFIGEEKNVLTASRANPQRQFGDDVLSRIQAVMQDASALPILQQLVVSAVNDMIAELAEKAGIKTTDITLVTAAGNTVMQLLLHGIDPSPLGAAPFQPPVSEFAPRPGYEIGLNIAPNGMLETLPIFGGFVGGDIVAGTLAVQPDTQATEFLIDIGTNGELVLFHHGKIYTAAAAAGPAFEGARIEHGTLAVPGAIDRVMFLNGQIKVTTIQNKKAVGICGSGLIDAVSVLLEQEIIKPTGQLANRSKAYELVPAEDSGIGEAISLTQRDIRQLQLAAGAIRAGVTLLLQQAGLKSAALETFYIAGGFGQYITPESAQRIGLIPKELPLEKVKICGNTSLAGAKLLLLDSRCGHLAKEYVSKSVNIELATLPEFTAVFAESMSF